MLLFNKPTPRLRVEDTSSPNQAVLTGLPRDDLRIDCLKLSEAWSVSVFVLFVFQCWFGWDKGWSVPFSWMAINHSFGFSQNFSSATLPEAVLPL